MSDWGAWSWDWQTWYWLLWASVGFFVPEFYAIFRGDYYGTLTGHLRPLFQLGGPAGPVYWIMVGVWLWVGVHFFLEGVFFNVDR